MLPKRLIELRFPLTFGLVIVLMLLFSGGCRVESAPTGNPTETPCESCEPLDSPLVMNLDSSSPLAMNLNSPLPTPTVPSLQTVTNPEPQPNARPSAQPPSGTPTLVVKTPTVIPKAEADLILNIVHTNDTWGYLDPCG